MADLNSVIDIHEARITKAIKALDIRIRELTSNLGVERGRLVSDQISIARAIAMRQEILSEFSGFKNTIKEATDVFTMASEDAVKALVAAGVSEAVVAADLDLVRAFQNDTYAELSMLGNQYASKIGNLVYTHVIAGGKRKDLISSVSQLLVGHKGKTGRPLLYLARTIVSTRTMEVYSTVLLRKAKALNIDKFRYDGSLIKDSRPWCVSHVNKVFTYAEIQTWADSKWAGKKEGDPFITRGGWNCRHQFVPVL